MKAISVSILFLILTSSLITITVEESYSTSKAEEIGEDIEEEAEDTGDKLREGAKDVEKDIRDKLSQIGKPSNNYNDNANIQNEFDNSEDKENNKVSIADEIRELAQLKKEGIITEEEFADMKKDLIE